MTNNVMSGHLAEGFGVSSALPLPGDVFELVKQAVAKTLVPDVLTGAASGNAEALETLGRSISVEEGKLLEAVVIALARRNPDMTVLTGMKLPVTDAALAIIERNDTSKVQALSLDPENRSKRAYFPDLILANRLTSEAIVIDVKRSIASYVIGGKLNDLKTRMQAAGLVLPDILWREHDRLAVNRVSIGIIDGSKTETDAADGIWPLSRLDELLGLGNAGTIAQSAIAAFRKDIAREWRQAVESVFAATSKGVRSSAISVVEQSGNHFRADAIDGLQNKAMVELKAKPKRRRGRPRKARPAQTVTVGLFRPAMSPVH